GQTARGGFDENSKIGGRRSAVIERIGPAASAILSGRYVELKPNTRYSFGGWARAETVGDAQAWLYLVSPDTYVRYATDMEITHYGPWRQYSTVFSTHDKGLLARPEIRFHSGLGKVWVDDLFLVEAPEGCQNMVVNGGFEGPEAGRDCPRWWWDIYGLMSPGHIGGPDALWGLDRTDHFEGRQCLRMINPFQSSNLGDPHPLAQQMLAPGTILHKGRSYVLSAWFKGSRPDLQLSAFVGGWQAYREFKVTDEWQRHAIAFEMPDDVTQPFIRLDLLGQGTVWVDAVQFEEGTEPTEYWEWRE
ncbi:MAG: hypothetical protein J7M38_15600, partial [Armatimonadetes bacterium]|nr:hypothetical protein [Armatimonadota bacterium]